MCSLVNAIVSIIKPWTNVFINESYNIFGNAIDKSKEKAISLINVLRVLLLRNSGSIHLYSTSYAILSTSNYTNKWCCTIIYAIRLVYYDATTN